MHGSANIHGPYPEGKTKVIARAISGFFKKGLFPAVLLRRHKPARAPLGGAGAARHYSPGTALPAFLLLTSIYISSTVPAAAEEAAAAVRGLVFSGVTAHDPPRLPVAEGSARSYTVALAAAPDGDVTVAVSRKEHAANAPYGNDEGISFDSGGGGKGNRSALTFSAENWQTAQTVTVSAAADPDGWNGTVLLAHAAAGGGYDGVAARDVLVRELDDDLGVVFAPAAGLTLTEGGAATYEVKPEGQPVNRRVWTIAQPAGGEVTVDVDPAAEGNQNTLTFTYEDWQTARTVTVSAAEDADGDDEAATLTHSAGGEWDREVNDYAVAVSDDDVKGLALSAASLTVAEGSTAAYTVALATRPSGDVTVTVAASGDGDLSATPSSLTFTTAGYSAAQTVTVTAAADADALDGAATFTHTASGGGYDGVSAALTATETDDTVEAVERPAADEPPSAESSHQALTFDPSTGISVPEGSTATYTVKLATQPTAAVTVTVAGSGDTDVTADTDANTTGNQDKLAFTTTDYNTAQTVTVSAAEDVDGLDGTATFSHSATGGGYASVTGTVTATEADNDRAFTFTPSTGVTVPEGSTATYTVKLATQPSAAVTVTVASTGDSDLSADTQTAAGVQNKLTFSTTDYNTAQTVTLAAAEDVDEVNGAATLSHTAAGGGYGSETGSLKATEADNDLKAFVFNPSTGVSVPEGSTASYTVKLTSQPSAAVTVTVASTGDSDLSADTDANTAGNQDKLTFSTTTWSAAQTVTVSAAEDVDELYGTAVLSHTASGGGYGSVTGSVTATERDNDADVCDRTAAVRDAIVAAVPGQSACGNITSTHLAAITGTLDLSSKSISSLKTGDFSGLSNLTKLYLNGNSLTSVPSGVFSGLSSLTTLYLSNNSLSSLPSGAFTGLSSLTTLYLSNNSFTSVPSGAFTGLSSLTELWLADNSFTSVPSGAFTGLSSLTTLYLRNSSLSSLSSGAFTGLSSLTKLYLSVNSLTSVPSGSFSGLSSLTELDLSANSLTSVPSGAFTGLSSLTTLYLSNNSLTSLPLGVFTGLSSLTELWLNNNSFTSVPSGAFTGLSSLTELILNSNSLSSVPSGAFTGLSSLTKLYLNGNSLTSLPLGVFTGLSSLTTLGLWKNSLTCLPTIPASVTTLLLPTGKVKTDYSACAEGSVTLSKEGVIVAEGSTATYTVKLHSAPSALVTLTLTRTGDTDVTADTDANSSGDQNKLTFTTTDYSTAQTVTLSAAEDDDGDAGRAGIVHAVSSPDAKYDGIPGGTVTATEADNDPKAFTFTPSTGVSVPEGGTATYTVKLATAPSASVTVTVARASTGTPDTDLSLSAGSPLTFTTTNYSTAQTVTLSAAEDDADGLDGTAAFGHTATGGGYDSVTGTVTATEADNDRAFTFTPSTGVSVPEGSTATYTVKLATAPSASVTVTVTRASSPTPDTDLSADTDGNTAGNQDKLTFTTSNYSSAQTVTLSAAEDDADGVDGSATFNHSATGGGYGSVTGTVTATEADNDRAFTFNPSTSVSVPEGGTAAYTVKLATQPSASVTVTVTRATTGNPDTDLSADTDANTTGNQDKLTFSTTDYNTAQTVTVSAAEDVDEVNGSAAFSHTATGGGYGSVTGSLTATEADNDAKAFTFDPSTGVSVPEGGTATYTVALVGRPSAAVTVTVTRATTGNPDTDLSADTDGNTAGNQNKLTFTTTDYNTAQTVTLSAAEDVDELHGSAAFNHTATGGGYGSVTGSLTATEADNDVKAFTFTPSTGVSVPEGGTATYTVALVGRPSAAVIVTVARSTSGTPDTDLSLSAGSPLTFSTTDYNTAQTVTLAAAEDADGLDGTADFNHTATGGGYGSVTGAVVTATEADDDRALTLSAARVTVTEGTTADWTVKLATQPSASVTVTVAKKTTGTQDGDLSVTAGSSLTFSTTDYNTAQTVTVSAAQDGDQKSGTAAFDHTASGGGYGGVSASVTAVENDDDASDDLDVADGNVALIAYWGDPITYTVVLKTQPSAAVTVTVAVTDPLNAGCTGPDGLVESVDTDPDTPGAQNTLIFTTLNWSIPRTVSVTTALCHTAPAQCQLSHTAASSDPGYQGKTALFWAAIDLYPGAIEASSAKLPLIPEDGVTYFAVNLGTKPTGKATVTVTQDPGKDADFDFDTDPDAAGDQTIFVFTPDNYASTIYVRARPDDDVYNGDGTLRFVGSGGGYSCKTAERSIKEVDDDEPALKLTPPHGALTEGSTATYTVALAFRDSSWVTVALSSPDPAAATVSPASLSFTTANWSIGQTVTVSAVGDADENDETVIIAHAASNGTYVGVTAGWRAQIADDDHDLALSPASLALTEGGATGTYTAVLSSQPLAAVTVTVASADDPAVGVSPGALTFTTTDWSSAQTVTLSAKQDDDAWDETVSISHTGAGSATARVTARVDDDDSRALTVSPTSAALAEGASTQYTVKLATEPAANVTVAVGVPDGYFLALGRSPGSLVFTTANWSSAQTVTVTGKQDDDGDNESVALPHEASGGGYDGLSATFTVNLTDDDGGLRLSKSSLALTEGGAAGSYTVVLTKQPSGAVTVAVASRNTGAVAASPAALTFGTTDWNTAQGVTVTPVQDANADDESVRIVHTAAAASSNEYDGETATLRAGVGDDDTRGLTFTPSTGVTVPEGSTATYTVKLATQPTGAVAVTLSKSGDPHLSADTDANTAGSQNKLTFTTTNYSSAQTVTVSAAEDADGLDGTAVFTHAASGGGYDQVTGTLTVTATEADNDRGLTLTPASLTVNEGTTATYTVKLGTQPSASVTVAVAKKTTGDQDGDLSLTAGASLSLTFSTTDWNSAQTVTLSAAEDLDALAGTARFVHTPTGGGYSTSKELTATEGDNDSAALTLTPAKRDGERGHDGELHGEAGDPAVGVGDGGGGEEERPGRGRGPVADRGGPL